MNRKAVPADGGIPVVIYYKYRAISAIRTYLGHERQTAPSRIQLEKKRGKFFDNLLVPITARIFGVLSFGMKDVLILRYDLELKVVGSTCVSVLVHYQSNFDACTYNAALPNVDADRLGRILARP